MDHRLIRSSVPGRTRRRPWAGMGLRARLTVTFGLGALALSASMAGITYFTARQFSLSQRQDTDVHLAYSNAAYVMKTLHGGSREYFNILENVDSTGTKSLLVYRGQPYSLRVGLQGTIPVSMRDLVAHNPTAATQIVSSGGSPYLVVGISLPSVDASYFELFSLQDLSTELQLLGLALGAAALVTTLAGAAVGRLAARRVLLPLLSVSQAAETIAGGRLDTRVQSLRDRDLAPLAKSFNRMADALQDRIQHEARFTSDVSHELRSPLTTLSASLGVLDVHREELSPKGRQALDLLEVEVRRFQRMVDDLMEISRMDSGSAELLVDEVEVGELVRQAAASTGARGVPVDFAPGTEHIRIHVDKRRIERVIANLVENAAQYADGATRLAVEPGDSVTDADSSGSRSGRSRALHPSVSRQPTVRIVVADHGPGIAISERDKVFERFYRGHSAGRRGATNGTGLGLSLVAEHVRLHGGRVWIEDGAGGENRFIVELPVPAAEDVATTDDEDLAEFHDSYAPLAATGENRTS